MPSSSPAVFGLVLDAFGTLVHVDGPRLRPYQQIWRYLQVRGQLQLGADPTLAMRSPLSLSQICTAWQIPGTALPPASQWEAWEADLATEISSVRLYPDVLDFFASARAQGLRLAICSNLALPYSAKVRTLLAPVAIDAWVWSFERQAIKPEPAIYQAVEHLLALPPAQLLMIGDSLRCDVEGPRQQGWRSLLLDRSGLSSGALNLKEALAIASPSRLHRALVK